MCCHDNIEKIRHRLAEIMEQEFTLEELECIKTTFDERDIFDASKLAITLKGVMPN